VSSGRLRSVWRSRDSNDKRLTHQVMRNPIRRNKNIGKTQGGRVKNGSAAEKASRIFSRHIWTRLSDEEVQDSYIVIEDNPSRDFFHPVSEAEIRKTLDRMPNKLTKHLRAVVMPRMTSADKRRGVEARRRYSCIILNPFPENLRLFWSTSPPKKAALQHYEPWDARWEEEETGWFQVWELDDLKTYYLFHLLFHELGHINQPWFNSLNRREEFAEDFALTWARKLNILQRENAQVAPDNLPDTARKRMTKKRRPSSFT
jgi:hypothetical protein